MSFGRRPSVANTLSVRSTHPDRVAAALERGKRELEAYAATKGVTLDEARAHAARLSALGRRKSRVMGCP